MVVDGGAFGQTGHIFDPTDDGNALLGELEPRGDQGGQGSGRRPRQGEAWCVRLLQFDRWAFSRLDRLVLARLDDRGGLQADLEENLRGLAAAEIHSLRLRLGSENFANQLQARIHGAAPLAESFRWSAEWDSSAPSYRVHLHFKAARFAHPIGDETLLLKPQILPPGASLDPWQTQAEGVVYGRRTQSRAKPG